MYLLSGFSMAKLPEVASDRSYVFFDLIYQAGNSICNKCPEYDYPCEVSFLKSINLDMLLIHFLYSNSKTL